MKTEDPKIMLGEKVFENGKVKYYIDRYKDMIDFHGSIDVIDGNDTAKVYNPNLFSIFNASKHPFLNVETNESVLVDGGPYMSSYIQGFMEGEKYFIQKFGISRDTLYNSNSSKYVNDIHYHYFHAVIDNYTGWVSVKKSFPFIIDHSLIRKMGYYSGIVSQVEQLVKEAPEIFEGFYSHDEIRQKEKNYKSLIRVHCFILAEAYHAGHSSIKTCTEKIFNSGIQKVFGTSKPRQYYLYVRSTYKGEQNFINFTPQMRKKHPEDYDFAMGMYEKYYPKINDLFPKEIMEIGTE